MKTLIALFIAVCSCAAAGQAPSPGPLTVVFDGPNPGCAVYLITCVSQVNGIPVCPYGRVAWYPLPGQPYTSLTYPKVDPQGKPISPLSCVSELQGPRIWIDPLFLVPPDYY